MLCKVAFAVVIQIVSCWSAEVVRAPGIGFAPSTALQIQLLCANNRIRELPNP